jgi:phosphoglycerol transferase MdoB-like AlkP superfamily enzyme
MQNYYKQLLLLVKRLMLIIVLMSVTRLIFYIFNYSFFATLSLNQVLLHFLYGIRFDLASVFLLNLGFIVFSTLPDSILKLKGYQLFLKIQYVAVNSILLAANLVDTKFYEFEGKRLTADFFTKEWLGEDFITLLPEFISDFWYIFLVFLVLVYALIKFYPRVIQSAINSNKVKKFKVFKQIGFSIFILILSISIGRGGLQLKPIGIIAAARYTSPEFMALILNSPFTILKTFGGKSLPNPEYFTLNELESIYNPIHKFEQHKRFKNKNVVIIILESFGKEYSGYLNDTTGFTPKFDSIMQLGLTYKNAFANGKRSIEALPSIFSGLPALMDNAFVNSKFSSNAVEGIGSILNKQGYYTAFYHGGKNGTMGFDNYAKLVGISNYFGIDQYPNEADYPRRPPRRPARDRRGRQIHGHSADRAGVLPARHHLRPLLVTPPRFPPPRHARREPPPVRYHRPTRQLRQRREEAQR